MMGHLQAHKQNIALAAILALALGLRLWGVGFGLPYVGFQSDEWFVADEGLILLRDGFTFSRLNIGTLQGYIQAGVGWAALGSTKADAAQLLTSQEMRAPESVARTVGMPYPVPLYYLWGRVMVAVMGAVTVWLTYLIGREIDSVEAGLVGALFLAASPLHAENSHYLTRTIPGLMFLLLAFYFLLVAYRQERWGWYVSGGILAGLAILTKQNNVIIAAPLALALVLSLARAAGQRSWRETLKIGGVAASAAVVGGLVLALALGYRDPASLFSAVIGRIWNNSYAYGGHIFGFSGDNTLFWTINYFLNDPWRFVFLLALPGMGLAVVALHGKGWLLLSVPIPYLATMSFFTVRFLHWLVPVIPFLGVLAGVFLVWGWRQAKQRFNRWPVRWSWAIALGALAITLTSFKLIIIQDYWFSQKDVRVTASEWLQANIPAGAKVVIERYGPYLPSGTCQVEYVASAVQEDVETYRREEIDYLVVNEPQYRLTRAEAASSLGDPAAKEYLARYKAMFSRLPLVREFIGPTMLYPGYWVRVYRID